MSEEMNQVLEEEKQLTFKSFNAKKAFQIGEKIARAAIEQNSQVCVEIMINGKVVFHFASDQCIPDNDRWLKRKMNTVLYFHHATKYMHLKLQGDATLLSNKYGLKGSNYAIVPGGFPILVENAGVIGAIAVSGMLPEDDHQCVVQTLKQFID